MASIVFGGGVSNIIGSHGGSTFARNGGGAYVKKRPHGVNPRSVRQVQNRTLIGQLSKYFTYTLGDSDRAAWRTFAATNPVINRLGNTTFLSAQQMFTRLNAPVLRFSGTPATLPPASTTVGTPTTLTIAAVSGSPASVKVTVATSGSGASDAILLWISPPLNPGVNFVSSLLRSLPAVIQRDVLVDISATYKSIFGNGPLLPGRRIFMRAMVQNYVTGVTSSAIQSSWTWT